jgi:hypothetical protein
MLMEKMLDEGNHLHNFISSSGSGTVPVINYGSDSDFLTSYGSGSTSQKVTVPTVTVPQRCSEVRIRIRLSTS